MPRSSVAEMLDRVSLTGEEADRRVRNYSLGMRQRLGIATALIGDPEAARRAPRRRVGSPRVCSTGTSTAPTDQSTLPSSASATTELWWVALGEPGADDLGDDDW